MSTRAVEVVLIAKPWRGGLADYVFRALDDLLPGRVVWLTSYPRGAAQWLGYRIDRAGWRRARVRELAGLNYRAALFINHRPEFEVLDPDERHVLWLTDAPAPGPGTLRPYARVFVSDPGYAAAVRAAAGPERYAGELAFAMHPAVHRPLSGPARGLCTVANRDPKRDAHLQAFFAAGLRPWVYGNYFLRHPLALRRPGRFRPRVAPARLAAVYARHAVSLNVHARVVREGTNMRSFECAGCGIAQLIEYRPGLERQFEPGVEVEIYREPAEGAERARALLADPRRARALAQRAARRACAEHTYHRRVRHALAGLVPALDTAATAAGRPRGAVR